MKAKQYTVFMLIFVIALAVVLWALLNGIASAQGKFWYLTTHWRWEWYNDRWLRITYPVVCSGYICRPACRTLYGGWGPCR